MEELVENVLGKQRKCVECQKSIKKCNSKLEKKDVSKESYRRNESLSSFSSYSSSDEEKEPNRMNLMENL